MQLYRSFSSCWFCLWYLHMYDIWLSIDACFRCFAMLCGDAPLFCISVATAFRNDFRENSLEYLGGSPFLVQNFRKNFFRWLLATPVVRGPPLFGFTNSASSGPAPSLFRLRVSSSSLVAAQNLFGLAVFELNGTDDMTGYLLFFILVFTMNSGAFLRGRRSNFSELTSPTRSTCFHLFGPELRRMLPAREPSVTYSMVAVARRDSLLVVRSSSELVLHQYLMSRRSIAFGSAIFGW